MIGGKYKSLILWKLMTETTLRFSQLQKEIPTATPKMLTQQLRELEANGLIHRHVYPVVPPKVEYSLTNFGKSIKPALESMYTWGSDYLNNQGLQVNCSMTAITDPQ
ncbi:helix-turn-helix domain-containing protein [Gilliamella sp. W8128]|uniref:winged helix-turn-helix transcriptional regulator n=1 Tax=Gilliamella sp. W8128 TaxID=2751010 RepID=UPI0018DCCBF4|nr:helix-turn-helix domain-containing protein [Gilliamella sp. W8128]MBI0154777.1 helix-turn-helix transcriptional regulator [Gilliamella sp. W8128]